MPGRCSSGWVLSATRSLPRTALPVTAAPPFSVLEVRVLEMETKHQAELAGARSEKEKLQRLVSRQSGTIEELQKSLLAASTNTSLLQRQQLQLLESVQRLVRLVSQGRGERGGWAVPCPPKRVPGCSASPCAQHGRGCLHPRKEPCAASEERGSSQGRVSGATPSPAAANPQA